MNFVSPGKKSCWPKLNSCPRVHCRSPSFRTITLAVIVCPGFIVAGKSHQRNDASRSGRSLNSRAPLAVASMYSRALFVLDQVSVLPLMLLEETNGEPVAPE